MTIFATYVKRVFAGPWIILLTIVVPVLIVLLVGVDGGAGIRVALFDYDKSELSRMVTDAVTPVSVFVDIEEDEIDEALLDGRVEYALILPQGLEDAVLRGERAGLRSHSLQGVEMTGSVRSAANALLSTAHNVARHVEGDRDAFRRAMGLVGDGRFALQTETFRSERAALPTDQASGVSRLVGLLTLTMLAMVVITCFIFLKDVETGTFHRTLAGPMSVRRYMVETNGAFFLVTVLQGIAAAIVIGIIFPQLGLMATLMLVLVLAVFSLVAVSLGLAVANIAKTVRRTQVTVNFLLIPMAMLGGAFWPVEIMPRFLQRLADFTPIRWVTSATQALLSGAELTEIVPHIGILLLFAVVFQLLGSWNRVDIAR